MALAAGAVQSRALTPSLFRIRGGILRRGLPLRRARAAVVTNVAADHLGQFGINTVAELAAAKFAVYRALADDKL